MPDLFPTFTRVNRPSYELLAEQPVIKVRYTQVDQVTIRGDA